MCFSKASLTDLWKVRGWGAGQRDLFMRSPRSFQFAFTVEGLGFVPKVRVEALPHATLHGAPEHLLNQLERHLLHYRQ